MKHTICTIATRDYFPYCMNLYESIRRVNKHFHFNVYLSDTLSDTQKAIYNNLGFKRFRVYDLNDLKGVGLADDIINKYTNHYDKLPQIPPDSRDAGTTHLDYLRWALKPVLIRHADTDLVLFCDNDLYFFNNYDFVLYDLMKDNKGVFLTPHFANINEPDGVVTVLRDGMFNAGFIGFRKSRAYNSLPMWEHLCLEYCYVDRKNHFFVDQKLLDILPAYYPSEVFVSPYYGCNVAHWNIRYLPKTIGFDGIEINEFPVIFIHVNKLYHEHIYHINDINMKPYLDQYLSNLQRMKEKWNYLKDI